MSNPDNARILGEEQAVAQQEASLLSQEQALWQRSNVAGRWDATVPQRVKGLLDRLAALERVGMQSSDFPKARAVLQAIVADEPALAVSERGGAIPARRAALVARENAMRALAQAITQLEALRGAQRRDLEAIDSFVQTAERSAMAHAERATAEKQETERLAAEKAAALRAEQQRATAPPPVRPPLAVVPSAPTLVVQEMAAPPKSAPPPPSIKPAVSPASIAPPPRAAPASAAPPKAPAPVAARPRKLVGRRRRVRRPPPPKKLDVDVAVWGENTFYTGFESKISTGGLFVSSLETLPAGHELDVLIALEGRKIQTRGRVEFARLDNTANPECVPGAGIKLLNLQPDQAGMIEAFFQKRPPLFMIPMN